MSNNILEKIIEDQTNNVTNAIPKNEFDSLFKSLQEYQNTKYSNSTTTSNTNSNITTINNNKELPKEDINIDINNNTNNPNTYDNILSEIQDNEKSMELAIRDADELSKEIKESLIYYLNIRKPNRNGILMHGVSDALNASAKLLDISVNGRYKLASMKKLRASIIKDRDSKNNDNSELSLVDILSE